MFLKEKLYILKMKEGNSIIKHIDTFRLYLKQFLAIRSIVPNNEAILALMGSLSLSYYSFISSLRRQPRITLKSLIPDFI